MLWTNGGLAALAGADADAILQRKDEDLAIADLSGGSGAGRMDDRLDRRLDESVVDRDFEFQLRQQANLDFRAAVDGDRGRQRD